MRVVFVTSPGEGHFRPLLPLAGALRDAGHQVTIATGPDLAGLVGDLGFGHLVVGPSDAEGRAQMAARFNRDGLTPDQLAIALFIETLAPPMVDDLVRQLRRDPPDLLIHEEGDYSCPIAAGVVGIPYVTHGFGPAKAESFMEAIREAAAPLWKRWGLGPPPLGAMYEHLYLDICPPCLQGPSIALIPHVQPLRPSGSEAQPPPAWLSGPRARPFVYATLGTVARFNRRVSVWRAVLEGLARLEVDGVVTLGASGDPASLGEIPANVRVEGFVPQAALLPSASCLINNGGAGSTLGALAHGVPVLSLPQGAPSQFLCAERLATGGMGLRLDPDQVTAEAVGEAVARLLHEPSFRAAAASAAAEMEAMPEATAVVTRLSKGPLLENRPEFRPE